MRFCRQLPVLVMCLLFNLSVIPDFCSSYHPHLSPQRCAGGSPACAGLPARLPARSGWAMPPASCNVVRSLLPCSGASAPANLPSPHGTPCHPHPPPAVQFPPHCEVSSALPSLSASSTCWSCGCGGHSCSSAAGGGSSCARNSIGGASSPRQLPHPSSQSWPGQKQINSRTTITVFSIHRPIHLPLARSPLHFLAEHPAVPDSQSAVPRGRPPLHHWCPLFPIHTTLN